MNWWLLSWTCSAKLCDNLLVEVDNFYFLRGIIFCNAKQLQFNLLKNHERSCTIQQVLYSNKWSFLYSIELLVPLASQKKISLWRLHCHFWWLLDKIYFLHKWARVYRSWIWKNLGRQLFIFNVMFMLGYYNEFKFVGGLILCQFFKRKLS